MLVAGTLLIVRCTLERRIPIKRDTLNLAILIWMIASTGRLYFDVRTYGAMALRDYAMVYYGAFFYLGQYVGERPAGRRFVAGSLFVACTLVALLFPLFVRYPEFFLEPLSIGGVPVIYFKGDLAGTFLGVGAVLYYVRYEARHSWISLIVSLALAAGTLLTQNRASMLGLVIVTGILALAKRWRFAAAQLVGSAIVAIAILFIAYVRHDSWHDTPLYGIYERAASILDPYGKHTYAADAEDKADNNLFRVVWWRSVFDDTVQNAPLTGRGYGYDLAERFVQEYFPDGGDDFNARSPHNVMLTVFARTGLTGFLPFLAIIILLFVQTIRACRSDLAGAGLWLAGCTIFISACFGVVLEGPMGAVVFWSILGIANANRLKPADAPDEPTVSESPAESATA
ncbi:MAG TPA: O-antigen ligase family protein [Opitutaceae bacterium]|nr:O-antigen ligase family protein [Opitutaceae bacterium]